MTNSTLRDFVQIIGITDTSEFPIIGINNVFTQFIVNEELTIPEVKPDVEQINTLLVEVDVTNTRNIFTPTGVKVVVEGILKQKVIYTAELPEQPVHSAHFEHRFCTFIDIPLTIPAGLTLVEYLASLGLSINDLITEPVEIVIEDVELNLVDSRTINKCVIMFAYTTVNPLLIGS